MKMTRVISALIFAMALTGVVGIPAIQAQTGGLDYTGQMQLANQFAPTLYLHPGEDYYPVSPDYAISRSDLKNAYGGFVTGSPTSSQLSDLTDPNAGYYLDNRMGTIEDDGIREDFLASSDSYPPTVHARVTAQNYNGQSVYAIQYFFYYPFNNGPMNTHEGDWEMVLVVCDIYKNPIFAAYSQHLDGGFAGWELVDKDGDSPKVYVARGSHANYFRPYDGKIGPAADVCSSSGRVLGPDDYATVILGGQGWLGFAGCWGDYGDVSSGMVGERGPVGPAYQGDRWDRPTVWAQSITEVTEERLAANWAVANLLWIILGIMGLVLFFTIIGVYRRKKKQGTLGPRLTPFLYIGGMNKRSIAAMLAIAAIVIGAMGYFMPWYTVTMDVSAGDYSTPGPVEILRTDGINGLSFSRPESGAGLVQVAGLPIPFAWLMLLGLAIFIIGTIGMSKTRKFGWKLAGRGVGMLVPSIVLILQVKLIGSFISGYAQDAPSEVTEIIETISANPIHGSTTKVIGDYGATTLEWGMGSGVLMFIIAAILFFIAAVILISENKEYFQTGQNRQTATPTQPPYQPQQPGYYPPPTGYYPPPAAYPPPPPQPMVMSCQRCGATTSVIPGSQPFQCQGCGNWMYPPPTQ